MAIVSHEDFVRVKNVGTAPLNVGYDGRRWTLKPGAAKDTVMPAAAAFLWFGDPRSGGTSQTVRDEKGILCIVPDRLSEVRRLRAKYGGSTGDEATFDDVKIPSVEVYDLDGDRLTMVIDDPQGNSVLQATSTVAERDDLLALVQRQQRQLEQLMKLAGVDGAEAQTERELPVDDSQGVETGPPKTAGIQPDLAVVPDVAAAPEIPQSGGFSDDVVTLGELTRDDE